MSNDFALGATWTLGCIFAGVLITLIFVAVLGDRGDPGPDLFDEDEPPIDPTPEEFEAWLELHTITEFPEANLLEGGR